MATDTIHFTRKSGGTTIPPAYYVCDAYYEIASNPGVIGDLLFCKENNRLYIRASSGWVLIADMGSGSGTGDVIGPASATNDAVALFSGVTGKIIKNSTLTTSNIQTKPILSTELPIHASTHETGGTDKILNVSANILTSGTVDPNRIGIAGTTYSTRGLVYADGTTITVAGDGKLTSVGGGGDVYKNVANVFTQDQWINKNRPVLKLSEGSAFAIGRVTTTGEGDIRINANVRDTAGGWYLDDITISGGDLDVHNDVLTYSTFTAGTNPRTPITALTVTGAGNTTIAGTLTVTGKVASASLPIAGTTAATRGVVYADNSTITVDAAGKLTSIVGAGGDVYKNIANVFTQDQTISKTYPQLQLLHSGTAKGHVFGYVEGNIGISANMTYIGGVTNLDNTALAGSWFQAYPDGGFYWYTASAGANPRSLVNNMTLNATGDLSVAGRVQVGYSPSTNASYPALRNTTIANPQGSPMMDVVSGTASVYAGIRASNFISTSNYNNLADLTCGPTNFTAGINVTAGASSMAGTLTMGTSADIIGGRLFPRNIATGANQSNYYYAYHSGYPSPGAHYLTGNAAVTGHLWTSFWIYPGDATIGAWQNTYFLAMHPSYSGLYTNGGLYVSGSLWVAGGSNLTGSVTIGSGSVRAKVSIDSNMLSVLYGISFRNTGGVGGIYVSFENSAGVGVGSISQNATGSVAYNTTSDKRLKTDLGIATNLTELKSVVIHDFAWKACGTKDRGIFAQDTNHRAVTVSKEDVWMVDYSKFVPDLITGWQQHEERLAALEKKYATL